jgi:uncharacterized protein (TIGR02145 family)
MKSIIPHLSILLVSIVNYSSYSQEKLEVEGAIIIRNSEDATPVPGTIRYNAETNDFEGYNGQWVSFTNSSGQGGSGYLTDINGNRYLTITVGTQTWMRENLRTTRLNDGTLIPEKSLNTNWDADDIAWCWYHNDPKHDKIYSKLYNWHTVNTGKLCPTGWHVPSDAEWTILTDYLGGISVAGGKVKSTGTIETNTGLWRDPNNGATNESGFTAVPGGFRLTEGLFLSLGNTGIWWSSTESSSSNAWYRYINYVELLVYRDNYFDKRTGYSVRCLKD